MLNYIFKIQQPFCKHYYKLSIDLLLKVLSNTREVYRNIASHDKKVSKVYCDKFISTFLTKDKELSSILDLFKY